MRKCTGQQTDMGRAIQGGNRGPYEPVRCGKIGLQPSDILLRTARARHRHRLFAGLHQPIDDMAADNTACTDDDATHPANSLSAVPI